MTSRSWPWNSSTEPTVTSVHLLRSNTRRIFWTWHRINTKDGIVIQQHKPGFEWDQHSFGTLFRVRTDIETSFHFPELSGTCKDQIPRFSRTQRTRFQGVYAPLSGKFEIWCNLRPQKSLQKCRHAVRLIMCKSFQGLDGDLLEGVLAVRFPGPLV